MGYLLDTNVISEWVKPKPNKRVYEWLSAVPSEHLFISVLTLGEIRKGVEKINDIKRKTKYLHWLEHELPSWFATRVLDIDSLVSDRWGRLLAHENRPLPVIDSLLAATALHYDFKMITRNDADFAFSSLEVINPWKL